MCWSHMYRCLGPKLAGVRKVNKELGKEIIGKIKEVQRLITTENEFGIVINLLEKHYLDGMYTEEEHIELEKFFNQLL